MKKNILCMLACLGFAGVICGDVSAMNPQQQTAKEKYEAHAFTVDGDVAKIINGVKKEGAADAFYAWIKEFGTEGKKTEATATYELLVKIAGFFDANKIQGGKYGTRGRSRSLYDALTALDGATDLKLADNSEVAQGVLGLFDGMTANASIVDPIKAIKKDIFADAFVAEMLREDYKASEADFGAILNFLIGAHEDKQIAHLYLVKKAPGGAIEKVQKEKPTDELDAGTVAQYIEGQFTKYGLDFATYKDFEGKRDKYIAKAEALRKTISGLLGDFAKQVRLAVELQKKANEEGDAFTALVADENNLPFFVRKSNNGYKVLTRDPLGDSEEGGVNLHMLDATRLDDCVEADATALQSTIKSMDLRENLLDALQEVIYQKSQQNDFDDSFLGSGVSKELANKILTTANFVSKNEDYTEKDLKDFIDAADFSKVSDALDILIRDGLSAEEIKTIDNTKAVKDLGDKLVEAGLLDGAEENKLGAAPDQGKLKAAELRRNQGQIFQVFASVDSSLKKFISADVSSLHDAFVSVAEKLDIEGDYNDFASFEDAKNFISKVASLNGLNDLEKSLKLQGAKHGLQEDFDEIGSDPTKLGVFLKKVQGKYATAKSLEVTKRNYDALKKKMSEDRAKGQMSDVKADSYTLTPAVEVVMKDESLKDLKENDQFKEWVAKHAEDFGIKAVQQPQADSNLSGGGSSKAEKMLAEIKAFLNRMNSEPNATLTAEGFAGAFGIELD